MAFVREVSIIGAAVPCRNAQREPVMPIALFGCCQLQRRKLPSERYVVFAQYGLLLTTPPGSHFQSKGSNCHTL